MYTFSHSSFQDITEQPGISPAISSATASNMFAGCQAIFTVGRFIGLYTLRVFDPAFVLGVHGVVLIVFSILTSVLDGKVSHSHAKQVLQLEPLR